MSDSTPLSTTASIDNAFLKSAELCAHELECVRGDRVLFSHLDLGVAPGQLLLVEGANGSGKTSLLRILAGLSPASAGEVRWRGLPIPEQRSEYCSIMIYLGHALGLKADLSALENLRLWRTLSGWQHSAMKLGEAVERVGLRGYEGVPIRSLSAGQRQRIALARLLLAPARLWILDEPYTALDTAGLGLVRGFLERHLAQGGLAVLTSHQPVAVSGEIRKLVLA